MCILISIYISIPFKNYFFSLQNKLFFFFHCFNLSPFSTNTKYSNMTSHSLSQHPSQIITYPANKEIKPPKQSSVCQNPSIKTLTPRSTQALPKLICLGWSSYLYSFALNSHLSPFSCPFGYKLIMLVPS